MRSRYGYPLGVGEDEELTHIGPGTPMGELFRRYWQPIAFSDELKDLPKRVRILGEDLVVFRDKKGRVGCLELHCSHRQASLEFGKTEEGGLRCHYHGWLYDTEGRVIDMPCEPPGSAQKHNLEHPAYPVTEHGGLVFAFMGPTDKKPLFPVYDIIDVSNRKDVVLRGADIFEGRGFSWCRDCNWLQVIENSMDAWHVYWLHSKHSKIQFSYDLTYRPNIGWEETPIGCRNIWRSDLPNGNTMIRSVEIVFPNIIIVPYVKGSEGESQETIYKKARDMIWLVPVDDYHVTSFSISAVPLEYSDKPLEPSYWFPVYQRVFDRSYDERQRYPDDPEAIESIGPIAIHARERLMSSDKGVILYRNILRRELDRVRAGEDPLGLVRKPEQLPIPTIAHNQVISRKKGVNQT